LWLIAPIQKAVYLLSHIGLLLDKLYVQGDTATPESLPGEQI